MEYQLTYRDAPVFYTVRGSGPTLVLLHGFLEDHRIWEKTAAALEKDFTVISIDLPGFGRTGIMGEKHSMELMAETVKAVLDKQSANKAVLVGHSMGGYVGLAFARKFPETLQALVLFHSQAAADDREAKINRDRTIEIVKQNKKNFITTFVPLLFAEENVERFAREIDALKETAGQTSAQGIVAALAGMRDREDSLELLAKLDAPVFFIIGKRDSRIPLEKVLNQIQLPRNSEALILDGVGHMGFIEAADLTTEAVRHFALRAFALSNEN